MAPVDLVVTEKRCCNWDHVRPCGPGSDLFPGMPDDEPICACGCTGYDERCGTEWSSHPDDKVTDDG